MSKRSRAAVNQPVVQRRRHSAGVDWGRLFPWLMGGVVAIVIAALVVYALRTPSSVSASRGLATGATVPSLAQPATTGQPLSLTQMRGSKLVVYFYEGAT